MGAVAFLAGAARQVENVKFAVSDRFIENGQPALWEIRAITPKEDEKLRKGCVVPRPVPGRRNMFSYETDMDTYLGKLAAACTVYPNLHDAELQESYGVLSAEDLLKAMLTMGEYNDYIWRIQEINGQEKTLQEKVDEAKNS